MAHELTCQDVLKFFRLPSSTMGKDPPNFTSNAPLAECLPDTIATSTTRFCHILSCMLA